jgi:hypothetical protein
MVRRNAILHHTKLAFAGFREVDLRFYRWKAVPSPLLRDRPWAKFWNAL